MVAKVLKQVLFGLLIFAGAGKYQRANNIVRYSNDKVDQLFRLFDEEKDAEIRKHHMRSIQKILRDDCPYTFLLNVYSHAALHRSLSGVNIEPYYFFTYFPQWYIHPAFR